MRQNHRHPESAPPARRLRTALLLGVNAELGTTALTTALEPKIPAYSGD